MRSGENREVGGNLEEEKGARSDKEEEDCGRKKKRGEGGKEEGEGGRLKKRGGVTLSSRPVQSQVPADPECARTTPSLYFWYRMTLKASDSIEDNGPPVLSLTLPLFVSLCLLGAFMLKGLKWTGKVSYPFFLYLDVLRCFGLHLTLLLFDFLIFHSL